MNDFKITIKGNIEKGFTFKKKGETISIIATMMQIVCDSAIISGMSETAFLKACKDTYRLCKKNDMELEENE